MSDQPANVNPRGGPGPWRFVLAGFAGFAALTWSALALAGAGWFHPLAAAAIGVAAAALAWRALRGLAFAPLAGTDLAAAALAIATLGLTLPPAEMILGGWDPGVYVHTAVAVAAEGALRFDHPDLDAIHGPERELFVRPLHGPEGIPEPFGGMRVLPDGRVSPQFYHAYPALMAVAAAVFGVWGALGVNPLLNVGAVLAFYALVATWTGSRRWGLAGAVLLALNPSQVWQARFSTAEMLTQLLLTSGFALLAWWWKRPRERNLAALLGGVALGLAQLTRYDTLVVLAVAVPILITAIHHRDHRIGLFVALGPLAVAAVHVWLHQTRVAPYYQPLGPLVGQALVLCLVATALAHAITATRWGREVAVRCYPYGVAAASLGWLGWMAFNWKYRPTLHQRTNFIVTVEQTLGRFGLEGLYPVLIGPEGRAMLFLQSLLGVAGLALALLGVVVLVWRADNPVTRAWAWAGFAVTLLLTWNPYNDLFMMWVSRRYVPVVVPWLTLALVVGLASAAALPAGRLKVFRFAPAVLVAVIAAGMVAPAAFLAKHRDWPGTIRWFKDLERNLPAHAIVYTDQAGFAAPLRFLWGHRTYELHFVSPERRAALHDVIDRAAAANPEVYVLTQFPPADLDQRAADWQAVVHAPMSTHILEQTPHPVPDRLRGRGGDFRLYRVTARGFEPGGGCAMTDEPRVLFLSDHLGHEGGRIHGATTYFLHVLPALATAGLNVTACFIRARHPAADQLEQAGVTPIFLNRGKWDVRAIADLDRLIAERGINLVHAAGMKGILLGRLAAKKNGARALIHLHDTNPLGGLTRFLLRKTATLTDGCLGISRAVCDYAVSELHIDRDCVRLLYNALPLDRFAPPDPETREALRASLAVAGGPALGIVGRLSPEKGHERFLRGAAEWIKNRPNLNVLLIGDGPQRGAIEALVASSGLGNRVRLLGQRDDVPDLLAALDAVVIPSVREGLGYIALEAMASGRPVAAFAVGGLPEIVINQQTGLLSPPGDVPHLVGQIDRLLNDPDFARGLIERGLAHAGAFSLDAHIETLLAIYRDLLSGAFRGDAR